MIRYKDKASEKEYENIHPMLRAIVEWLLPRWPEGHDLVITRIFDPRPMQVIKAAKESGIHATKPHRALDVQTKLFPYAVGKSFEAMVNEAFKYGDKSKPARGCALFHKVPGSEYHLHLQARDETTFIGRAA